LDYQNDYVRNSIKYDKNAKKVLIPGTNLNDLRNYFDDPTKLFFDMYLTKFLVTSAKSSILLYISSPHVLC